MFRRSDHHPNVGRNRPYTWWRQVTQKKVQSICVGDGQGHVNFTLEVVLQQRGCAPQKDSPNPRVTGDRVRGSQLMGDSLHITRNE
jgi:hypothetical protein